MAEKRNYFGGPNPADAESVYAALQVHSGEKTRVIKRAGENSDAAVWRRDRERNRAWAPNTREVPEPLSFGGMSPVLLFRLQCQYLIFSLGALKKKLSQQ